MPGRYGCASSALEPSCAGGIRLGYDRRQSRSRIWIAAAIGMAGSAEDPEQRRADQDGEDRVDLQAGPTPRSR
jgi:hypothetical protein